MLRKFIAWFIVFGLSFLVQSFGWTDQGTAFLWIHLGGTFLMVAITIILCLFAGRGIGQKFGLSFLLAISCAIELVIILFATWGATKLFPVEFTVAYQIMTFGQCLCSNSNSNKKDKNN